MADLIVTGILLVIIGTAVVYIIKSKKGGARCIGCSPGSNCSGKSGSHPDCCCGCHSDTEEKD